MRLRVNNGYSKWHDRSSYVEPLRGRNNLIVVIDPSKTNCAIVVGNTKGDIYHIAECSGNDKDFYDRPANTTEFCIELTDYLEKLLKDCPVARLFVEAPINPWKKGKKFSKKGFEHYQSQMVLTEIRGCLLLSAQKLTCRPAEEIPNYRWKAAVLPEGYRGHDEKGSHRYLSELDYKWSLYSHDVTDAVCMYMYAISAYKYDDDIICDGIEDPQYEYKICIIDENAVPTTAKKFTINTSLTCEQNSIYYVNRESVVGAAPLDISKLSLADINKYAHCLYTTSSPYLLVKRGDRISK